MTRIFALALGLALALLAFPARSSDTRPLECEEARLLAQTMFGSDAPMLYAPLHLPRDMQSTLILGTAEDDISGGDALTATDAFEKLRLPTGRSVYWLREPGKDQKRIAVAEDSFGWRGDMYSLYLLDRGVAPTDFMREMATDSAGADATAVLSDSWRPPLVFQLPDEPGYWFIDVGQPFEPLARWTVYATDAADPICSIAFGIEPGSPERLLPTKVRALSRLLDEALGPGSDEGTLQPTAAVRNRAAHVRANATFRPWALADIYPYNSRAEIDAGLKEWARGVRPRQVLLQEINESYAPALKSLATFYERFFGLSDADAERSSAWALDIIFRSYFVFARGGKDSQGDGGQSPWPREAGIPKSSASGVHLQLSTPKH
jgi:hypothetical protein